MKTQSLKLGQVIKYPKLFKYPLTLISLSSNQGNSPTAKDRTVHLNCFRAPKRVMITLEELQKSVFQFGESADANC